MKPSLLLPTLLLAALPATLHAAPGTVHAVLPKLAQGSGGLSLANNDRFGASCAVLGDLDGDGVSELVVGAPSDDTGGEDRGAVHLLFLNPDGSVKSKTKLAHGSGGLSLADFDQFGTSCTALGDLDGDGVPDLAAGARGDNTGGFGRGAVHLLFLRVDGTVKSTARIAHGSGGLSLANNDLFGSSCAVLGDLDGDGVPELSVGAIGDGTDGAFRGAVHVLFLRADGTVKSTTRIAHGSGDLSLVDLDQFGFSLTTLGDLDGDGVPEIAVGAIFDSTAGLNRGAVHVIFLDADGTVKSTTRIAHGSGGLSLADNDLFGISCATPGDLDGDGVPELAAGANLDDTGGNSRGAVHLLFLRADGTVKSTTKIADGSGTLALTTNDEFGYSCAPLGDLDGDGVPELAVGAHRDDTGGGERGAVHFLSLGDPPLKVTTLADELDATSTNGTGVSLREAIRDADTANEFRTIRFDPSLSGGNVLVSGGANGPLSVSTQSLRITGEGLNDGITIQSDGFDQIFSLTGAILTVDGLNLRNGAFIGGGGGFVVDGNSRLVLDRVTIVGCKGFGGGGGAIFSNGSVSITNSTFLDNTADFGGAIRVSGATATLNVLNSTFARNSATSISVGGGAILNGGSATTRVRYCTFVGNTTQGEGGGLVNDSGSVTVAESLFSGNSATTGGADFASGVTDGFGNASVATDQLMTFGDYGGPTPVQPLKFTSSVKGTAFHRALPATDQRGVGFPRTVGKRRDPGAVEGTDAGDFQPDNRIGLSAARQVGNNRYNTSGAGQTISLRLKGRRKAKTFFTVQNDGILTDSIRVKSDAPNRRSLNGKVFSLTGGRRNVSAQVFRTGLVVRTLVPGNSRVFQGEWSRKSLKIRPRQTAKLRSTSLTAPKSDVAGTKVSGK